MSLLDTLLEAARFIELQERRLQGEYELQSRAGPGRAPAEFRSLRVTSETGTWACAARECPVAGAPVQRADARRS